MLGIADEKGNALSGRYLALLEVSAAIAAHRTLEELFKDLGHRLHSIIEFNYLSVLLYDSARNVMRVHILNSDGADTVRPGMEFSMDESPAGWVWKNQEPLVLNDLDRETRFSRPVKLVREYGVRSFCSMPLTTPRRRLGAFTLGNAAPNAYSSDQLEIQKLAASQVAVAVENALNYQDAVELQQQVAHERDRMKLLLDVNNAVVSNLSLTELFKVIPSRVRLAMQCDGACLSLPDLQRQRLEIHGLDFPEGRGFLQEEMQIPIEGTSPGKAFRTGEPVLYETAPQALHKMALQINFQEGVQSGCFLPLIRGDRKLGVLHLLDRQPHRFSEADAEFLQQVSNQVAIALDNAMQYREVDESRERLAGQTSYLRTEIRAEQGFDEILGETPAIQEVLRHISTVAPTNSTVLILGETGTGKELVARAIHNLSSRRENLFAKLNCAAIPSGLLESELFGHEKGAFTGAIAKKVGRFEVADKGTLFLDEVGDIPSELQPKLLRVLQEQEFERLGSSRSIHVDVRLVAATNQDLGKMVEDRRFRADLYYRLNVFPIRIPALRDRREDIPLLTKHFVTYYGKQMNKRIDVVRPETMEALMRYDWPGNIRELQNFIERAVILSQTHTLCAPVSELARPRENSAGPPITLEDAEREHILQALHETQWVLGGSDGAANRLGMPRTTLIYKMKRLGIARQPE
ncbi:MAG TPA: sigma 54-interacting transcriptional regulator [Candidatus Sulfotelmatobacter sp.]|jgi:formate hydrogenlyase transcriptional activator|nr:sigma 54-interacting transcriptional regulator [Candidatus Sulfotelmatobacter sp.]